MASSAASLSNSLSSLSLSSPPPPSQPPVTLHLSYLSPTRIPSQTLKFNLKPRLSALTPRSTSTSNSNSLLSSGLLSVLYPSYVYSNILFFKSAYNVQIVPDEDGDEESIVDRFRREVLRARIIQECKRRRFHETNQEKRKRKSMEAARRYGPRRRNRHLESRWESEVQHKHSEDEGDDNEVIDNWEY